MPFCAASAHGALSRTIWLIAGILLLGGSSKAVPVGLRAVEASAEALDEHALQAALDGDLSGTNGGQLKEGNFEQQFAVFATEKPISAAMFQVQFFFLEKD